MWLLNAHLRSGRAHHDVFFISKYDQTQNKTFLGDQEAHKQLPFSITWPARPEAQLATFID